MQPSPPLQVTRGIAGVRPTEVTLRIEFINRRLWMTNDARPTAAPGAVLVTVGGLLLTAVAVLAGFHAAGLVPLPLFTPSLAFGVAPGISLIPLLFGLKSLSSLGQRQKAFEHERTLLQEERDQLLRLF